MRTSLICTFGRFNPPTKGHEKLLRMIVTTAKRTNLSAVVFLSNTEDTKENPLTHAERSRIITKSVSGVTIGPVVIRTPNEMLTWAKKQGYAKVFFAAGSDRRSDFQQLIDSWSREVDLTHDVDVRLISVPRDESKGSGSVAREYAKAGKLAAFQSVIMSGAADTTTATRLMKLIRRRLTPITAELHIRMKTFAEWLQEAEGDPDSKTTQGGVSDPGTTQGGMGGPADGEPPAGDEDVPDEDSLDAPEEKETGPYNTTAHLGRVPSDTPQQQARLVIHPTQRMKHTMKTNLQMWKQRNAIQPK